MGSTTPRGVSPVVGVILMVARVVVLAAVLAAFVLGLGALTGPSPEAGVSIDENPDEGTVELMVVDSGNIDELRVRTEEYETTIDASSGATTTLPAAESLSVVGVAKGNEGVVYSYDPKNSTIARAQTLGTAPANKTAVYNGLSGNGTDADPYRITNVRELQVLMEDKHGTYVLEHDIEASFTLMWNNGSGFEPMGAPGSGFEGTLDGNGHTINGLTINRGGESYVGLFGISAATIRDIRFDDPSITAGRDAGVVSGAMYGTGGERISITDVQLTVGVDGNGRRAGALTGSLFENASADNVSATGARSGGGGAMGGLIGRINENATVSNSFARVEFDQTSGYRGGLIGRVDDNTTVTNVYAAGDLKGDGGGVIGNQISGSTPSISDAYWDREVTGVSSSAGGTSLSTAEMTGDAAETNMAFDFGAVWQTTSGYPRLR